MSYRKWLLEIFNVTLEMAITDIQCTEFPLGLKVNEEEILVLMVNRKTGTMS